MPNIATTTPAVDHMVERARLARTLKGGTRAMRRAGETYLPKERAETPVAYNARLARSTVFNGFAKTVRDQTGRVFRKPLVLKDDVPAEIKADAENIDLAGRHLNIFARDVFFDALQSGIGYILADAPVRPAHLAKTVAAERAAGLRPYLVYVRLENMIGWKSAFANGAETLTQVRIKESATEPDGDFAEKSVDQIRVLEPGKWSTWRRKANAVADTADEWELHEEGETSLPKIT